jgi:hypothetical protein
MFKRIKDKRKHKRKTKGELTWAAKLISAHLRKHTARPSCCYHARAPWRLTDMWLLLSASARGRHRLCAVALATWGHWSAHARSRLVPLRVDPCVRPVPIPSPRRTVNSTASCGISTERDNHGPPPDLVIHLPSYKYQASCGSRNPRIESHHHCCAGSHWERDSIMRKCVVAVANWLPASVDPRRLVGAPVEPQGEAFVVFAVGKADWCRINFSPVPDFRRGPSILRGQTFVPRPCW